MFSALIMVIVSRVYAYVQTHQNVYIKYVEFFVYQLCINKAFSKEIEGTLAMIFVPLIRKINFSISQSIFLFVPH